ncbi:MAG TPA: hypothetical protein VFM56_10620 [Solimonas sp.]|nr:hypothetical protein [Solimonas sp.]
MKTQNVIVLAAVAAGGVLAYLAWRKGGALLSTTLNPASDQNAAYTGTNSALQAAGVIDENQTLGTAIYDWLHTVNPATGQEQNIFSQWWDSLTGNSSDTSASAPGAAATPYDYGQGGAPGVPWAPTSTAPTTDPAPWWAGNPFK